MDLHEWDDMSHLVRRRHEPPDGKLVASLIVKPTQQEKVKLGSYPHDQPPKGFVVDHEPHVDSSSSIVTRIVTIKSKRPNMYDLVLFLANYSQRDINFKVWQI